MKAQSGFTLIELAIALMVIGLLIGGVLKGQELIENARITKAVREYNDIKTAVAIFRSTYNAVPGDMLNPQTRLSNCNTSPCFEPGNANGLVDNFVNVFPDTPYSETHMCQREQRNFWFHLAAAGMLKTMEEGIMCMPSTPFDIGAGYTVVGYVSANVGPNISPGNYLLYYGYTLPSQQGTDPKLASRLDEKADDGKPITGDVRAMGNYNYNAGNNIMADCADVATNTYNPAPAVHNRCNLGLRLD